MTKQELFHSWAYGMFVHYGLYSIPARGEWLLCKERMPLDEYFRLKDEFHPQPGIARGWASLARRAGMKYMCLTTRHHDGFFVGDALVREYCEACREFGLGVGLYYSVGDWSDTTFWNGPSDPRWGDFVARTHRQLKELMSEYGEIDYLFYDGCPRPETWGAAELHQELRKLQPALLISCRCGLDEDVFSSEQHSGQHNGCWESCYTLNGSWGYNQYDRGWKTAEEVIDLLTALAHNGGNLLLNIGLRADGSIQTEERAVLERVGDWLKVNGDAVYGVKPHPFDYDDQEISVEKDGAVYIRLHHDYRGPERLLCGIGNKVTSITLLSTGARLAFRQERDRIFLDGLPYKQAHELPRVLRLEIEGKPFGVPNPMSPRLNFRCF